jgi:hypothetical protein
MNRRERMIIAAALAAITLLPIAAFILLRDTGGNDDSPRVQRVCSPADAAVEATAAARPTATPVGPKIDYDEFNRLARENVSRPFVGMLCGFEIVATADEALPQKYCRGTVTGRDSHSAPLTPLPSELNKPGLREQGVCDDTEVFSTYGNARRNYFRDTPKLNFAVNRELLRVIDVDGHPVLLQLSPSPLGPVFVAVVQRWPEGDKPGILIALMAGDPGDAVQQVRKTLAE